MEKFRKATFLILSLSCILVILIFGTAFAQATKERYAWTQEITDFWVFNQCNGEWLVSEGKAHYATQWVGDSSGGGHWMFRGSHNLRGIGQDSGKMYQVISTFTQHLNANGPDIQSEWTFMNTSPLISYGGDQNMIFFIRNHVAVNAKGEWTVSFSEVSIECR